MVKLASVNRGIVYMLKNYDNLFYIKTTNTGTRSDQSSNYNQYEATPYSILYALFQAYELEKTDGFVDFGCGKGRLLYYVHNHFGASVTGIEMDEQLYEKALANKANYLRANESKDGSIHVECCLAEDYDIKETENKFYFFNPFSVEIFMEVINNILESVEQKERDVDVILYYPTTEYVEYLESNPSFELAQEVKVPGLYEINHNERFLIFRFKGSAYEKSSPSFI